jgi:hypothetical protein
MLKKTLVLIITVMAISFTSAGQDSIPVPVIQHEKKKGIDPQRLYFGGNFGLSFGDFTFINISPIVGYRITNMFSAGAVVNFIYQSSKYYSGPNQTTTNNYGYAGLGVFGRFQPLRFLLLSVQPETNYIWGTIKVTDPNGNYDYKQPGQFVPSLLIGGGVAIPTGGRGSMIAMLQYDVIQNDLSPYGKNLFFSFGFNF